MSELRLGANFLSLTSSSPFVAAIFPPSPHCLLRDLMVGSTMSDSGEEIPTSGEDTLSLHDALPIYLGKHTREYHPVHSAKSKIGRDLGRMVQPRHSTVAKTIDTPPKRCSLVFCHSGGTFGFVYW